LTLEPQSGHYEDPVVVCDFTALYPSLMIAYNLCYSTCVGKLEYQSTRKEMKLAGRTCGRVGPLLYPERRSATVLSHHFKSLESLKPNNFKADASNDRAYIAPTGTMYVSENVLKGVLPQVLDEMLTTRAMLKRAAKEYKKHVKDLPPSILRQLEARQLALKYVANVTYGVWIVVSLLRLFFSSRNVFFMQVTHLRHSAGGVRCHFLQTQSSSVAEKLFAKR
jgi:DNA polymerase zeta